MDNNDVIVDQFLTIKNTSEGEYKEKGSKFIGYCYPFIAEEFLDTILAEIKSIHPKARHYCYAYKIGLDENRYRTNDDGEPSGTAGKPIFGQILSHNLTNILIVVVRYFGGTKLGASGLIHAYRESAFASLQNAEIITDTISKIFSLTFGYEKMGLILATLKDLDMEILEKEFDTNCLVTIQIRLSEIKQKFTTFKAILLDKSIEEIEDDTIVDFCQIVEFIES